MTERTIRFGWWKNQYEIVHHDAVFSLPRFQTLQVSLGPAVSDFTIRGLDDQASTTDKPPPIYAQGTSSCEIDLPAGTFVASCGRSQDVEASASLIYRI